MTSDRETRNGYVPVLETIDSAVDTATKKISENAGHTKASALKLLDKVKAAVDNAYNEANERISSHFHDQDLMESIERSFADGETPHLVADLAEESLGFDALFAEGDPEIITKDKNSMLVKFPRGHLAIRLETYVIGSGEQSPAFRYCISRRTGFLVQPIGMAKKEIYPGTFIYCTVYSDSFLYRPETESHEDGTVSGLFSKGQDLISPSRLEAPEAMSTMYALHLHEIKKDFEDDSFPFKESEVESIFDAIEDKFSWLYSRDLNEEIFSSVKSAHDELKAIREELKDEKNVLLLGDSIPSVVFREFIGSAANVNTFYYGPAVFDLGYVAHHTGLLDDENELYSVLYRYKLGSRSGNPLESEGLVDRALRVGKILRSLKGAERSLAEQNHESDAL